MTSEPLPGQALSETVRRWLVAVDLLVRAEQTSALSGELDGMVALILADASSEAVLSLIVSEAGTSPPRDFDKIVDRAAQLAPGGSFPRGLATQLKTAHQARNGAMHHGLPGSAALATEAARRLLEYLPTVSGTYVGVPAGTSLLGAVATMVAEATEISDWLRRTDELARGGEWGRAADAGAAALYLALRQLDPPMVRSAMTPIGRDSPVRELVAGVSKRVDATVLWLTPMILGISPATYASMMRTLGEAREYLGNQIRVDARESEPSAAEVRLALEHLALIVARLWVGGTLFRGARSDAIKAGYRLRGW